MGLHVRSRRVGTIDLIFLDPSLLGPVGDVTAVWGWPFPVRVEFRHYSDYPSGKFYTYQWHPLAILFNLPIDISLLLLVRWAFERLTKRRDAHRRDEPV